MSITRETVRTAAQKLGEAWGEDGVFLYREDIDVLLELARRFAEAPIDRTDSIGGLHFLSMSMRNTNVAIIKLDEESR